MNYFVDKRDFKKSLELKLPKVLVKDYFIKYCEAYDNLENKEVRHKLEHRELFKEYSDYMYFKDDK